jgi:hypothetical protein
MGKEKRWKYAIASFRSLPDQLRKPCQPSSVLFRYRTSSCSVNGNVKSGEDRLKVNETKSEIKSLTRLAPELILIKHDADSISASTNITASIKAMNKSGLAQSAVEDMELVKHEGDAAENGVFFGGGGGDL